MASKVVPDSVFIGNEGAYLVPQIVNEMRFLWTPSGQFELGIDGTIEIVDPKTAQGTGNIIKAQIKTTSQPWPEEAQDSFSFTVRQQDLDYWLNGNTPVILICCKAGAKEAYWMPVKEYFDKIEHRHERKVRFVKSRDRFTSDCRDSLIQLAAPQASGLYLAPIPKHETLYSNLLPVAHFAETVFHAPTECGTDKAAAQELEKLIEHPQPEWIVTGKRLYSFHNLSEFPWSKICDVGGVETLATSEWSESGDRAVRRDFVRLLNRCLSEKLKQERIRFSKQRHCYFFEPDGKPDQPEVRVVKEVSISRAVAKTVVMARMSKTRPGHISYWRHLAIDPHFVLLGGQWYLEISPTYVFTYDGGRYSKYGEEYLKGIKKIEKNNAVLRNVLTWASFLQPKEDWFAKKYELLKFGPLLKTELDVGIQDTDWLSHADEEEVEELRADLGIGQEMLL